MLQTVAMGRHCYDLLQCNVETCYHLNLQQVELNHQLQAQLLGLREEHQAILQQLKEAHNLIQRHVETSVKLSASKVGVLTQKHTLFCFGNQLGTN